MTGASPTPTRASSGATRIRWEVIERRLHEMGIGDTDSERALRLGVSRNTVLRWRHGWTGVQLATAQHVARVVGVGLDQLIEEA